MFFFLKSIEAFAIYSSFRDSVRLGFFKIADVVLLSKFRSARTQHEHWAIIRFYCAWTCDQRNDLCCFWVFVKKMFWGCVGDHVNQNVKQEGSSRAVDRCLRHNFIAIRKNKWVKCWTKCVERGNNHLFFALVPGILFRSNVLYADIGKPTSTKGR